MNAITRAGPDAFIRPLCGLRFRRHEGMAPYANRVQYSARRDKRVHPPPCHFEPVRTPVKNLSRFKIPHQSADWIRDDRVKSSRRAIESSRSETAIIHYSFFSFQYSLSGDRRLPDDAKKRTGEPSSF